MKTGSRGIPLNYSIVFPVWCSMKCAILMLHEKYNIKNKWPNIWVRNKKVQALKDTSWMKPCYRLDLFCAKSIKQPQLFFTKRRLLFCLTVQKEEWHFIWLGEWKMDCAENESVALTISYWNWTMFAHI